MSSFHPPPPPPPVPPRPQSEQQATPGPPPPLPPLPPGYAQPSNYGHPQQTFATGTPPPWIDHNQHQRPHTETPIPAPRPFKVDYEVAGNMARTLDDNLHSGPPPPSMPYQGINYTPGFIVPSPAPPNPNPQPDWLGWNQNPNVPPPQGAATPALPLPYPGPSSPYPSSPAVDNVSQRMANLTFSPPPQFPPLPQQGLTPAQQIAQQARDQVAEKAEVGGTVPIPTIPSLTSALPTVERPNHDPNLKIVWCRDVFWLVNHQNPSEKVIEIRDPQLLRLFSVAIGMIIQLTTTQTQTPWYAEALYHKASIISTPSIPPSIASTFPQMKYNPRSAFRDFEASARQGHARAWFKLGRDYESFNDFEHAKDCFERGVRLGQGRCLYRMGIAFLLGQLNVERDIDKALGLLQRAAEKSDLDFPEGGYVWALLLLGEFTPLTTPLPPSAFVPYLPPSLTRPASGGSPNSLQTLLNIASKQPLLTSASLHFAPAQYKLGHAYEFATPSPPFHYDPLLSVEWYSKASQGGEVEADMALSKWFLCGAPPSETGTGGFEKDEGLAFTFAERAAKQNLPTALFALGYYLEVGIGPQGIDMARSLEWYRRAAETGNEDAKARLEKLEREGENARLGRQEHEGHLEGKLVRRRTQAKERSDRVQQQQQQVPAPAPGPNKLRKDGKQVVDNIRKHTLEYLPEEPFAPPPQAAIPPRGRYASSTHSSSLPPQPQNKPPYPAPNHRYTLADNPPPRRTQSPSRLPVPTSNSAPTSRPTSSAGSATSGAPTSVSGSATPTPTFTPAKPHYPATFAEMGIQGARAEDKECVIM